MSIALTDEFSIDKDICDSTKLPFGAKYGGKFAIRRPSLHDKRSIALKDAAILSEYGDVNPGMLSDGLQLLTHIEAFVTVTATEALPEWFDSSKMYEDQDEEAMLAVWSRVQKFLNSFRPKTVGDDGGKGGNEPKILVQKEVPAAAE